jgi:transposase
MHLAAYLLQKIYDLTDRQVEYGIKDNAAYQVFCGKGIVEGWHPPDHTKIEVFRNRLSPETQRALANETAKIAISLGFADPRETDIDSTVQEANIAYLPGGHPELCEGPRRYQLDPSLRSGHSLRE